MRSTLALTLFALVACDRPKHPWEGGDAGAAVTSPPPLTSAVVASALDDAGADAGADDVVKPPVRVGGPWVRCYGNFHPSGEPVKDVTRLSILCGPENGMHRLSKKTFEGTVREGGPPVSETFAAKRGECYRVFAVAESSITDLDVGVLSSRGARVAADHGEDSWPIVQPDRPFCPLEDDTFTIEISAKKGAGAFAEETWVLKSEAREPKRGVLGND